MTSPRPPPTSRRASRPTTPCPMPMTHVSPTHRRDRSNNTRQTEDIARGRARSMAQSHALPGSATRPTRRTSARLARRAHPAVAWREEAVLTHRPASCRTAAAETSCSTVRSTPVGQLVVEARLGVLLVRTNVTYWTCASKQHVIVSKSRGGQLGWRRCGACSGRGGGVGALTVKASSSVITRSLAPLRAREGSLASS